MDHSSPNCLITGSAWRNFNERLGIAALHLVELFKKQVTGEAVADPLFNVYPSAAAAHSTVAATCSFSRTVRALPTRTNIPPVRFIGDSSDTTGWVLPAFETLTLRRSGPRPREGLGVRGHGRG